MANPVTDDIIQALQRLLINTADEGDINRLQQALLVGELKLSVDKNELEKKHFLSPALIRTAGETFKIPPDQLRLLLTTGFQAPALPSILESTINVVAPASSRLAYLRHPHFVGRDMELQVLYKTLVKGFSDTGIGASGFSTGVIISGQDGIGKTQLAIEFCYRYGADFNEVFWIDYESDLRYEVAACGKAMGLEATNATSLASAETGHLDEMVESTLRAWVSDVPVLLVIDNAVDVTFLNDWVRKFPPNARLMVILSQNDSAIRGVEEALSGLDFALNFKTIRLSPLSLSESREMLRSLSPHLMGESDYGLNALLTQMEGMPLGLDLAGRCLVDEETLSIEDYLRELDSAGIVMARVSRHGRPHGSEIQRIPGMALAFAVSWKHLRQSQKASKESGLAWRIFHMCGYCAPNTPIPWELIARCSGKPIDIGTSVDTGAASAGAASTGGQPIDEQKLYRSLYHVYQMGLLINTREGTLIHPLIAEFSRWIEEVAEEGSVLPALVSTLSDWISLKHSGEPGQIKINDAAGETPSAVGDQFGVMPGLFKILSRRHVESVTLSANNAGLTQSGVLWHSLGKFFFAAADYYAAQQDLERAVLTTEMAYGSDDTRLAQITFDLGVVLEVMDDLVGTKACYEQALRIWNKQLGSKNLKSALALSAIARVRKKQGDLVEAQSGYERVLFILNNEETPALAQNLNSLGEVLEELGNLEEAQVCYEQASRIFRKLFGTAYPDLAHALGNQGRICEILGDMQQAQECYYQAFRSDESVFGLDAPASAQRRIELHLNLLINLLHKQNKLLDVDTGLETVLSTTSASVYFKVLKIEEAIFGVGHIKTAERIVKLADYLIGQGNSQGAKEYDEKYLHLIEKEYGQAHPKTAAAMCRLGNDLFATGDFTGARTCFEKALRIYRDMYGDTYPNLAALYTSLGKVLSAQKDWKRAKNTLLQALMVGEAVYGADHPEVAAILTELGIVLVAQENFQEAKGCFERALNIDEEHLGVDHPDVARDANNLGEVLYRLKELDAARELFERALQNYVAVYGARHASVAVVVNNLASVIWTQGDGGRAKSLYVQALQIDEQVFGADHLNIARDACNLGNVLKAQGDTQGAYDLYQRALRIRQRVLPPSHPKVQSIRRSLAMLETMAAGQRDLK